MRIRVGIDVGGTFTDVVVFNVDTGRVQRVKVLSTPRDPSVGVIAGLKEVLKEVKPESIELIVHASTIGSNLFLGQLGLEIPKVALITTRGFRDVLEIGRQRRPEIYNVFFTKPRPLVPRRLRLVVTERVASDGRILIPLREDEVREIVKVIKSEGVRAVAVCLLNSYVNPVHEKRIVEILREECPDVHVVASYEVDPEYREFERMSTTVVNAVLLPVIGEYLMKLEKSFRDLGIGARFLVMLSSGGIATIQQVSKVPAATLESGPAAGVVASAYFAKLLGLDKVLSFDMGGTTAKVGTVVHGVPLQVPEFEVGGRVHRGRLVKGSGYVVRYPHIDLAEVSAGGGTIAWVDEAGSLRVGPYSAGADPGPACYGKGGTEPTVTDANLVLGRLGKFLAGGRVVLRKDLAERAIREKICEKIGLDLTDAAYGIIKLVNVEMARAMRIVTVERGLDPREFTVIAFGGAGPMHVCELADELGIESIVVPPAPGTFTALGLLLSDFRHDLKKCVLKSLSELSPSDLERMYRELEEQGREILLSEGVSEDRIVFIRYADLRYWKQSYELTIEVPSDLGSVGLEELKRRFMIKHEEVYGYYVDEDVVLVNVKVAAIGLTEKPKLKRCEIREKVPPPKSAIVEIRDVYFGDKYDWVKTTVYSRDRLVPGAILQGPAIVEEYDSTTVIPPNWSGYIDEYGNLILRRV